ncbi:RES family NAD+ phosphorylase [Aeromonas veronii]|uniref:RES family NAD+ phosphorylase n=1 Tax=Aeromonas veronii TaxID=654 RepID=UPI003B9ECEED
MAIMGFNLDQTRNFEKQIQSLRKKLRSDLAYKEKVLSNGNEYEAIKSFFSEHLKFLQYTFSVSIESLYRVRKLSDSTPFIELSELLYPPKSLDHKDRMNNMSSRVLYTSLHEYTAMAETQLGESYINNYFQLTKFSAKRDFQAFKLGQFAELYKEMPRDSDIAKSKMNELFGSPNHDSTVRGFAALECAIADILYDQEDEYHVLSSIMADSIFTVNSSVEAIIYPSVKNRYGVNLALKKELADTLEIKASFVNKLEDVYSNGFFKYQTLKECTGFSESNILEFSDVESPHFFRHVYR